MKNLKKSLALVLAIVMVFSLVVFANAAFTDEDQIAPKYKDAVGVMAGLGILNGVGDGSFNPQGTLERAQAAKIVAYLKMGKAVETLPANQVFADVAADHWAAKYVAYGNSKNIINGYGDGNFGPTDKLSGYAFGKMLLVALGYGQNGEYTGSEWAIHVAEDAAKTGLFKGLEDALTNDPISREVASQLAFNALGLPMVQYLKSDEVYEAVTPTQTLAASVQGLDIKPYTVDDANGRPVKGYYKLSDIDTSVTPNKPKAGATPIYSTTAEAQFTTNLGYAAVTANKNLDLTGTIEYFLNTETGSAVETAVKALKAGATIEVFGKPGTDGKIAVDKIIATVYVLATVKEVKTDKITLDVNGSNIVIPATDKASFAALSGFAEKDKLAVAFYTGNKVAEAVKAGEQAVAKITAQKAPTITFDGNQGVVADTYYGAPITLGAFVGTFYTCPNGAIIGFAGEAGPETPAVYVLAVAAFEKAGGVDEYGKPLPPTYFVQTVSESGEKVNYQVKDKVLYDDQGDTDPNNDIYSYGGFVEKGAYELTLKTDKGVEYAEFSSSLCDYLTGETYTPASVRTSANDYFTSDIKFIFVEGSLGTCKVTVKEGVQTLTSRTIYYHYVSLPDGNYKVAVIFVDGAPETAPATPAGIAYAYGDTDSTATVLKTDGTGKEVTAYVKNVPIDGVMTEIYVASGAALDNDAFYEVSKNGELTELKKIGTLPASLVAKTSVTNITSMGFISVTGHEDMAYANAKFVNLSTDPTITGFDKVSYGDEIALGLGSKGELLYVYYLG